MGNSLDPDTQLAAEVAKFEFDPAGFSERAYDWGVGELATSPGPRKWQQQSFQDISNHLANPETRFQPFRMAVASGHGIGKSAFIGMILNWAMSTHVDCRADMTANTEKQLWTKTMPEVAKWFRRSVTSHWFKVNATSVHIKDKNHEKSWRLDAITWSKNNTEAFAGLHNEGKIIIRIFDESSAIDDNVFEVSEGALTDENTIIIWIAFGNPTRNTGAFKECFGRNRHRWKCYQIDSRDVEGTNKTQIAQWIEDYGLDSDFVKVRVRGLFPSASLKQFISVEDVDKAYGREIEQKNYNFAPKIISCDPAWEGDDELVIAKRQGLKFEILRIIPKNDNDAQIGSILGDICIQERPDAVFIDQGYGTGIYSWGKTNKFKNWQLIGFADASSDPGCLNKRAEMWKLMRDWLKEGGCIPKDASLLDELIGPETVARMDGKIQLEAKKDMKARGQRSPNRADALALTFARPVNKKAEKDPERRYQTAGGPSSDWMG